MTASFLYTTNVAATGAAVAVALAPHPRESGDPFAFAFALVADLAKQKSKRQSHWMTGHSAVKNPAFAGMTSKGKNKGKSANSNSTTPLGVCA